MNLVYFCGDVLVTKASGKWSFMADVIEQTNCKERYYANFPQSFKGT